MAPGQQYTGVESALDTTLRQGLHIALALAACAAAASERLPPSGQFEAATPNDNRSMAGRLAGGVYQVALEARPALWRPRGDAGAGVPVLAFAEAGDGPTVPGPLIRVTEGTVLEISVSNQIPAGLPIGIPPPNRQTPTTESVTGPAVTVHGLGAGTMANDVVRIPYGEERRRRYVADTPGTYLYWADTTNRVLRNRTGLDAQLSGAVIVDPKGGPS